ncbi:MAG TPA: methyltransferase domain-containing protein [Amycolatopsis sp.]|nr:methyltransferase domain-containing protein [Amycolatopsis sp.]
MVEPAYGWINIREGEANVSEYLLDNREVQAGDRFGALSAMFDGVTDRHFSAIGVRPGWRCWEIGAGGPGVPGLLAGRGAQVLATDIEIGWLDSAPEGVEVRQHDVVHDEIPGEFDLIHTRLVLAHLPERDEVVRRLASALRPGGWLFVEDAALELLSAVRVDLDGERKAVFDRIRAGFVSLLEQRGASLHFGAELPRLFRGCGLVDVVCDARVPLESPGGVELERANIAQVRGGLVAQGFATDAEIDAYLAGLDTFTPPGPPLISAYARRV